jgi:ribosomal protein L31E
LKTESPSNHIMAEKPKSEKKKETKQEEEKVITIPLRHKADKSAKNMRMNRSIREIRLFLARHMKAGLSDVSISQQLNESLWKGGFHKPPASIKVKVSKDDEGKVRAQLIDEKGKPKKERKSRLGLRERLARRKEESVKEEKSAEIEKKTAKAAPA